MAEWGSEPNWTPFEEINGGQQFSKQFGAQDLNALAENIAYLYEHQPTATPIFDGTINIESGNTTISGSYLIDESKAYSALQSLSGVKTYNVNFSAGGSGSGMGDSIDFTSMTFDATSGLILYNDKGAFAMNGGFAEYNNNYGDGNGARVNFAEGTECRKEFKDLFLSIADEYTEPVDDSIVGTWVFNNTVSNLGVSDMRTFLAYSDTSDSDVFGSISYSGNSYELACNSLSSTFGVYFGLQLYQASDASFYCLFRRVGSSSHTSISAYDLAGGSLTISKNLPYYDDALIWLRANATKQ